MSIYGIVCETNPIHNGHKHLMDTAKEQGADAIVCIMSGNTVQRGEFAIADKYTRAEALLRCGADLVLELPFPWSASSAEYFARAAIYILQDFCDTVIFGSECGSAELLEKAALCAVSPEFKNEYGNMLADGEPAAAAYFGMLENTLGVKLSSNDLLGVEYIKAIKHFNSDLDFKTVKRLGDNYTSAEITDLSYPSAMSIRGLWQKGEVDNIDAYIPSAAVGIYREAIKNGNITDRASLDMVLLTFFRSHIGSDFNNIAGASGGLANRICEMSHKAKTADELMSLVKTKRYTDSSIKRTMLYCMAGVERSHIEALPSETLLLSADKKGRELLASVRKHDGIKIYTKPSDLNADLPQNYLSRRIDSLYTLLHRAVMTSDSYIKKGPIII